MNSMFKDLPAVLGLCALFLAAPDLLGAEPVSPSAASPQASPKTSPTASPGSAPTGSGSLAAEADGLAIFRAASRRDSGYGGFKAAIAMEIVSKSGSTLKRQMRLSNLESRGDGAKALLLFENPPDVKGTVLVSHGHRAAADEQWIFLPAFKRVKKVSDATKASPFMGSDFSYEDILSMNPQVDKFAYAPMPAETLDGLPCHVVERKPKYANSGYSRQVVWLDTADLLIRKIAFYGTDGKPAKVLVINGYAAYQGKHWRAREMVMQNLLTGGRTVLRGSEYVFGNALGEAAFDPASIGR